LTAVDPVRVDELLERARGVRILVVGDLMLDRYVTGQVERVSPEAPVPVVRVESEHSALGGAGNVAANVAALGSSCRVVGHVGSDPEGDELLGALESCGARADGVVRGGGRPTTVKTRVAARHQQIVRFDRETEEDADERLAGELSKAVTDLAVGVGAVVAQDYNKGALTPTVIRAVMEASAAHGIPVVVDPKRRNFLAYGGATVFKPNARELADALGVPIHPGDSGWMESTRRRLGCAHLLVTLGERGMAVQTAEDGLLRLPTAAQAVFDVSGAGDTVSATVAVALAAGASIGEAALLANHAAAVEVGKPGVQIVRPEEIRAHVRAHREACSDASGTPNEGDSHELEQDRFRPHR